MGINPGVFNILSIISFFKDYKGAIRNLIFLILFWVAGYCFGPYLLHQSDKYFDGIYVEPNPPFAYFLIGILILDFAAYFVKFKTIKYHIYQNKEYFAKKMGCLSIAESFMIGASVLYSIVPGIWLLRIINPALPADSSLFPYLVTIVVIKWAVVAYKLLFFTPNKKGNWDLDEPTPPPQILDRIADIVLTITTAVLFTVIWQLAVTRLLRDHPSFAPYLGTHGTIVNILGYPMFLIVYAIVLYMPTRLVFIMEDYYALTDPRHRRAAFLTSVLFIVFSVGTTLLNTVTHI